MELRPRRYLRHNGGNFWEERHNADWFKAGIAEMESAIEEKRAALTTYKRDPSEKTLTALRKARGDTQRIARRCANDYWLDLCQDIQLSADCDNTRKMYKGMKKAFGPTIKKMAALRSAIGEIITVNSACLVVISACFMAILACFVVISVCSVVNSVIIINYSPLALLWHHVSSLQLL